MTCGRAFALIACTSTVKTCDVTITREKDAKMTHQFTVNVKIEGISLQEFKRLAEDIQLHENICRRIPGHNLEILQSERHGDFYTLKRSYNLDVHLPDIAQKLLKDAFRLKRTDVSDFSAMTSSVDLTANLPLEAQCQRSVKGDAQHIEFQLVWTVKVKVPLIAGMLERHAEKEIRKFSLVELEIVEDELRQQLAKIA